MTQSAKDVSKSAARRTKKSRLIKLLKTRGGKDITAISKAFGWQQHTTRAALRKAGFEINRQVPKSGGAARYQITGEPQAAAAE